MLTSIVEPATEPAQSVNPDQATEQFVESLTAHQSRLYAYIYSLIGDAEVAKDTLQETNRVLWRKAAEFDHARPFLPWAIAIAGFQVRAARTRMGRERLCFRDDASLQNAADEVEAKLAAPSPGERELALESCLEKLTPDQREMLAQYYGEGRSTSEIGAGLQRRPNTVAVALHRIRELLGACIRTHLGRQPDPSKP